MTVTHEVTNQAPPLTGFSAADDPALLAALRRDGGAWGEPEVLELGALAGSAAVQDQARWAEEQPPRLHTHDRYGRRVDEVEFHPAWHQLMATAVEHGLHAAPWTDARPGAHLVRAAKFYV
ncbi:DNA alkylation response protein, partial [Streptomyces noursei]